METAKKINENIPDTELIEKILAGEKKFFEIIMRRYNPRLFRIGRSVIKNDDEVEDILQDTYMKVYENLERFEHRSSFSTWLIRILLNTAFARKSKIDKTEYEGFDLDGNHETNFTNKPEQTEMKTPEKNFINNELKTYLESAVDNLPQIYRTVFMMREIEKMDVQETSQCLNISESNVKVRLNRAKEMLRENLSQIYSSAEIFQFMGERCDRIVEKVMGKIYIM